METRGYASGTIRTRWAKLLTEIQVDESKLLQLEPRLTETGVSLYCVSTDPAFQKGFIKWLTGYGKEQRAERPQKLVVEALKAIKSRAQQQGDKVSVKEVAMEVNLIARERELCEEGEYISAKKVGGLLRSLGFNPKRTMTGYQVEVDASKLDELASRYKEE